MTSKWRILFSSSTEEILTESHSAALEHHSRKHFFCIVSKGEAARRIGCRGYGAPQPRREKPWLSPLSVSGQGFCSLRLAYAWVLSFRCELIQIQMSRYHCPFCSSRYQIHKQRADGVLVCGQCGDPLVKVPFIRPTQIVGLVAAAAFIAPLLLMGFLFIQDEQRPEPKRPLSTMAAVSTPVDLCSWLS